MSNIMLFVEENLLHHADKCYGMDYLMSDSKNNGDSTECLVNIPLVSPQSTLNEKPLASQTSLSTESPNLLTFLRGSSTDNNKSVLNPFESILQTDQEMQSNKRKFSTNPFLDGMETCQDHVNNLSPEMFMQIWETNLRLQMQITSIFNILMAKLGTTPKKVNNHLLDNETKENYEQRLLYASELLESIILKEDISSLLASKPASYSTNMKYDATSNEIFMPPFSNSTNYTTPKPSEISDNSISKALLEYLKQIDERNGITLNSTPQVPSNKTSYQEQGITAPTHSPIINNLKRETSACQGQNSFIDNTIDHFQSVGPKQYNGIKNNGYKETNPFKILLELKDSKYNNASTNQAGNPNTEAGKYCLSSDTNFNKNYFEMNNVSNHTSTIQQDYASLTNRSVLNPFNSEYSSPIQKDPFRSFQNTNNVTLESEMTPENTTKDQYQFNKKCTISHENSGASLNADYNFFNTHSTAFKAINAEQLINSKFASPGESVMNSEEFLCFDKSNNRPNSSILKTLLNETNIEEAKINNSHRSPNISANTWIRDAENSILFQAQFQDANDSNIQYSSSHKNIDLELRYCLNREHINGDTNHVYFSKENSVHFKIYNDDLQINTDTDCIACKEELLKNNHETATVNMTNGINAKEIDIPYYEFLISTTTGLTKLFSQTVEIRNKRFCIFHFENRGWLLLNDFVEAFTTYGTISEYYKQLQICNISIAFKEIKRFESPTLFFQLDKMQLNVPRDNANKINNIHLMPLKSIIAVLTKLQIVTRAEVNDVIIKREFKQYSILQIAWILISTYGKLKSLVRE